MCSAKPFYTPADFPQGMDVQLTTLPVNPRFPKIYSLADLESNRAREVCENSPVYGSVLSTQEIAPLFMELISSTHGSVVGPTTWSQFDQFDLSLPLINHAREVGSDSINRQLRAASVIAYESGQRLCFSLEYDLQTLVDRGRLPQEQIGDHTKGYFNFEAKVLDEEKATFVGHTFEQVSQLFLPGGELYKRFCKPGS